MNDHGISIFEQIYAAIKEHCSDESWKKDCFQIVSKAVNIPLEALETYLDLLKDIGLITYSMTEKYIYLTNDGNKTDIKITN